MRKPTILVLNGAFLPGFKAGGPVVSVANLVAQLEGDFEFRILTSDRDLGDTAPYPNMPTNCWISTYKAQVCYCSPSIQGWHSVIAKIRETPHDLLYLNSFFSVQFSILPLLHQRFRKTPTLLAPRGEFSTGALALKATKKRIYLRAGKALGLFQDIHWHASTRHELQDIRSIIGADEHKVSIACDLPATLPDTPPPYTPRAPGQPLRVLFLSRISPMKNLDYALEIMTNISFPVEFTIVGPEEDAAYSKYCREIAERLPDNIQVHWAGAYPPTAIPQAMADNDIFFLPTRGENFGHVIAESLGAGTPILLSDTTPWRGLEELGLGYDLPLNNPERFREALRNTWNQTTTETEKIRAHVAQYARHSQRKFVDVEANRNLFNAAINMAN